MTSEWCRVQLSRYAHQRLPSGFSPLDSCLAWRRQIAVIESDFVQCSVSKENFFVLLREKKAFQYLFQPQRLLFPGLLKPSVFNIMLRERYRPDSLTRNQMKEAVKKKIRLSVKRTWKNRFCKIFFDNCPQDKERRFLMYSSCLNKRQDNHNGNDTDDNNNYQATIIPPSSNTPSPEKWTEC